MLVAIIQARMTSRRLPGKVLKEVLGKPLLLYQVEQLRGLGDIEQIIIATTTSEEDNPIVELCKKKSIAYFRGSEDDVLERFYQTALEYEVDTIVRLTADCPLIDPEICDWLISTYLNERMDLVHTGLTFAEGLDCEIFSFEALEEAYHNAKLKSEREHVTLYIYNHPELFKIKTLENKRDDSKYRFAVDEPEDFEVVKAIIEGLSSEKTGGFTAEKVKNFLAQHPKVFNLNAGIIRNEGLLKSLKDDEIAK